MSKFAEVWATEKLQQLKIVTNSYSSQEKEQIRLTYLNNLLSRLIKFDLDSKDIIIGQIESVINALPKEFEEFMTGSYQPIFHNLVFDVKKRFNLIPKNFHRNDFNPLSTAKLVGYILGGISIYLISMQLKKPSLVIGVGFILIMSISTVTGVILDKKAQSENRVL
jgi:hypothetical protein